MTLVEFHQNQLKNADKSKSLRAKVQGFSGNEILIERLQEMGIHEGLELQVIGQAPFGGPLLFRFGNTVLALRREEAECALIQIL